MKRYSLGLVLLVLTLALGTAAFAVFPVPDSTATFTVQQGFGPNGQIVWFFCTDTNSIGYASTMQYPFKTPTLAPPLLSAYNEGLQPTNGRKMYINVCMQQGPVFNRLPGDNNYGGVWSVIFIKFLPGKCRRVCNLDPFDAVTNPFGFPITAGPNKQADLLSSYGTIQTGTVLDCPIVAVGTFPTSGPWFHGPGSNSNPSVFYRLEQVIAYNAYYKTVTLPAWYVFCQDFITKYINRCTLIIPDASTLKLANRLKANYAPGLNNIDSDNFQKFFFIDGRVLGDTPPPAFVDGGPVGILKAVNQLPIIEECPTGPGAQNINRCYVPLMKFRILEYTYPPENICFVSSAEQAKCLLYHDVFTDIDGGRINAPVLDCVRIAPPTGQCCLPCP